MPRYLSAEWFREAGAGRDEPSEGGLLLEQAVIGGPEGPVVYRVRTSDSGPRLIWPVTDDMEAAALRLTSDWSTAVAIAAGELSTSRALMEGRVRVRGDATRLAEHEARFAGADPVPAGLRRSTTYA